MPTVTVVAITDPKEILKYGEGMFWVCVDGKKIDQPFDKGGAEEKKGALIQAGKKKHKSPSPTH